MSAILHSRPAESARKPLARSLAAWGGLAAVLCLTLAAYWPTFSNGFVFFDDDIYAAENPHVLNGFTRDGLIYAWTTTDLSNWIPLTWHSYQLDAALFGPGPFGFHLTNLLWHLVNVSLLFAVWWRYTASAGCSLAVAALFAVHPLHVESVAWIAERKDVLSTFWLLVTLWNYGHYAERPGWGRYAIVAACFIFGLLSKPMLVTLPVLLLLFDYWPLGRFTQWSPPCAVPVPRFSWTFLLIEKLPLLTISVVFAAIAVITQGAAVVDLAGHSLEFRLANAVHAAGWYVWKTILPTELCGYYLIPEDIPWPATLVALLTLVAITFWVGWFGRRRPHLIFGWGWFLVSLLPVIGLVQVGMQSHADRYTYVPHLGLLTALVWEIRAAFKRLQHPGLAAGGCLMVVLPLLSLLTWTQVSFWQGPIPFWSQAVAVNPRNWYAQLSLGGAEFDRHQLDDAAFHLEAVTMLRPQLAAPYALLGEIAYRTGNRPLAGELSREALARDSKNDRVLMTLSLLALQAGERETATRYLEELLEYSPENLDALRQLGAIRLDTGDFRGARVAFERAALLAPHDAFSQAYLAEVWARLGNQERAKAHRELADHLAHGRRGNLLQLAERLERAGDQESAVFYYRALLAFDPHQPTARRRLEAWGRPQSAH